MIKKDYVKYLPARPPGHDCLRCRGDDGGRLERRPKINNFNIQFSIIAFFIFLILIFLILSLFLW